MVSHGTELALTALAAMLSPTMLTWSVLVLVLSKDHATLVFKQGAVDVAGIQASNPFQLAVTGGTGRFQNARGQATVQTLPGKGNPAKVTLSLLP